MEKTLEITKTTRTTKDSTVFIWKYLQTMMAVFLLTFFLAKMPIVQKMDFSNPLMIAISAIIAIGIISSIATLFSTKSEAILIERMVAYTNDTSLQRGELPLSEKFSDSILVQHFQKLSLANQRNWSDEVKNGLDNYFEEMFLRSTNAVKYLDYILAALGLIGTLVGFKLACHEKSSSVASMLSGADLAMDTTILALYGGLAILTLNSVVEWERKILLKTFLVILRLNKEKTL
jgi:hypothetical protein